MSCREDATRSRRDNWSWSLGLPFPVCLCLTSLARKLRKSGSVRERDLNQGAYYLHQYRSTSESIERFLRHVPLGGVVLDIGAGLGGRAPCWIERGAERVLNIDINMQELEAGKALTAREFPQFADRIRYCTPEQVDEQGSMAIVFDTFEHLTDPAGTLEQVASWLRPRGLVWIGSVGWYNHMAAHIKGYIPIPWCQLLFSEDAMIRTIRRVVHSSRHTPNVWDQIQGIDRWDHVTTLRERPGEPLNMLSLRQCEAIMRDSPLELVRFDVHGFSGREYALARCLAPLAQVPIAREAFHTYYTAILRKPGAAVT